MVGQAMCLLAYMPRRIFIAGKIQGNFKDPKISVVKSGLILTISYRLPQATIHNDKNRGDTAKCVKKQALAGTR